MPSCTKLLAFALLTVSVNAATSGIVPPASKGVPDSFDNLPAPESSVTDVDTIVSTVAIVDQKGGAEDDTPPNQPVPETTVTAIDGQLTENGTTVTVVTNNFLRSSERRNTLDLSRRANDNYVKVFNGTGTGPDDRDGSIQGTAYLTYTVIPNATYNIDTCLDFCDRVQGCVFANLYYEYNNELLDFVFHEQSNLKCAIYGDTHTVAEKTNMGGQQLEPPPAGLTYIQESTGWAAKTIADPPAPAGYDLVFGPTGGANNAPGYMGFAFLDRYDVAACAALCNTRGADRIGGACQFFNIWRAVVNGNPTTYTCSMYYQISDESTAVNYGQGDLKVTYSRGYSRKSLIADGGFEGFGCANGESFCYNASSANWIGSSPPGGSLDASIFHYQPYARTGNSVALLGSADGLDNLSGTLTYAKPLATVPGQKYTITFFHASVYSGQQGEKNAFVDVLWNDNVVSTIRPGYSPWTYYEFTVTAQGQDRLAFHGGQAPAWSFIDDVYVFAL